MRTLNVRRTVILLVAVIAVAGSAHLLHSYQLQRNSSFYKTQAKAAWDHNPRQVPEALRLMATYLVLEPLDIEAREELGVWCADSGRFDLAFNNAGGACEDRRKTDSAGRADDSARALEADRHLHGAPQAARGCRVPPGEAQGGTARRRRPVEQAGEVPEWAGATRNGGQELLAGHRTETRAGRHLLQQGADLAFCSPRAAGGSRGVHGEDDRGPGKRQVGPRPPRLRPVA